MKRNRKPPKVRDSARQSPPNFHRQIFAEDSLRRYRLIIFAGMIAAVYLFRIDRPPLWCDEAETGIEARSILRCGLPIAYDGRNLSLYESGIQVNRDFIYKQIPWAQYYLGALSITIFGDNGAGLRILFALIGVAAFFPIYSILKKRAAYPDIVAALALMAPQIVLFQRNARYFSILILVYSLLIWHLSVDIKKVHFRYALALFIFILFFQTHPFAALCSSVSLLLYCLFFRRKAFLIYFISSAVGFISWFVWYEMLGPPLSDMGLFKSISSLIATNLGFYLRDALASFLILVVDMDAVDCVPLLFWAIISAFLIYRMRKTVAATLSDPLPVLVLLNIIIQIFATAFIFGYVKEYGYTNTHIALSYLRFMPHLLVFAMLSGFIILNSIIPYKRVYLLSCAALVFFNLFTISYWTRPFSRDVPISWMAPVYSEIFHPPENIWDGIISNLRDALSGSTDREQVINAFPNYTQDVAIYYLGDRYFIRPQLDEPTEKYVREYMGAKAFDRLMVKPTWVIDALGIINDVPGYESAFTIPSYQINPDDGSRPELTNHCFSQSVPVGKAEVFRLKSEND